MVRLKELREEGRFEPEQIAVYLHISQKKYLRYELDKASVPVRTLFLLAKLHHVSMDYIAGLTDVKSPYPASKRK